MFSVVYFEDRADSSIRVRRDELSHDVSVDSLAAAAKTGTRGQLMQQIFFDVHLTGTDKRGLPRPPIDTASGASRVS